jgi:hypothetical protein
MGHCQMSMRVCEYQGESSLALDFGLLTQNPLDQFVWSIVNTYASRKEFPTNDVTSCTNSARGGTGYSGKDSHALFDYSSHVCELLYAEKCDFLFQIE